MDLAATELHDDDVHGEDGRLCVSKLASFTQPGLIGRSNLCHLQACQASRETIHSRTSLNATWPSTSSESGRTLGPLILMHTLGSLASAWIA